MKWNQYYTEWSYQLQVPGRHVHLFFATCVKKKLIQAIQPIEFSMSKRDPAEAQDRQSLLECLGKMHHNTITRSYISSFLIFLQSTGLWSWKKKKRDVTWSSYHQTVSIHRCISGGDFRQLFGFTKVVGRNPNPWYSMMLLDWIDITTDITWYNCM